MTLTGRRVLVTGGGTGLGRDLARGFTAEGAEVVIAGRTCATLEETAFATGARWVQADVTDPQAVARMFDEAGRCDIVVANAGAAESGPFARVTHDDWQRMIAVNLTGVFLTFQEGLRRMGDWGRLLAVASTAGLKGYAYVAPYAAAKHGVVGLVRSLALEVARKGITANALCPGFLDTEMTDRSVQAVMQSTGRSEPEARAALAALNPQKRLIAPAEVTAAALWLCGPGSEGINGQAIAINGGEA
ncbi:SDR family NAD(P)-dependent oxidoreductase [Rubellimicrobium roseum]|uniref:SDR family oxidoreductase n=1 Tax=Rubellimicrobium roseum TaxID=687525 RepID=A0A5C4NHG9_9RHOB|nr:SDR family oxidoreductase [Rubellimicrobium roseum]TNC73315.1 SDR family oxidoreductase [Rubellimicrobium roseum]